MQELLKWCRMTGFLLENLRRVLNMPRPAWNVITITVENARPNDCFLRVWYSGPACEKGLLFACNGGVVSGNEPKGRALPLLPPSLDLLCCNLGASLPVVPFFIVLQTYLHVLHIVCFSTPWNPMKEKTNHIHGYATQTAIQQT
jgi:hypothetical protein